VGVANFGRGLAFSREDEAPAEPTLGVGLGGSFALPISDAMQRRWMEIPMVNPSGESTMLGQWRIVLRRAEEAARGGRFEEAGALASQPDVADHYQLVRFRDRLGLDLISRAARRAEANDAQGAIDDLALAERFAAPPDQLAEARMELADRFAGEVREALALGEPDRALSRIDELVRHKIANPALKALRELAEAWRDAADEARRGEFGRARDLLGRAERLAPTAGAAAVKALAAVRADLAARQKEAAPKVEALYAALADGDWPRALAAAEALVATVPDHPAARRAQTEAWRRVAAISPSQSSPWSPRSPARKPEPGAPAESARPMAESRTDGPSGRFLLWVDAVGGYLACLDDRVVLGRAGAGGEADVPLMGDISRNHAAIVREAGGYRLEPLATTFLNGKSLTEPTPLRNGDIIRLGQTVELEFHQPSPVSATARLAVVSRHRLPMAVDGVLLMAETCIVGPGRQAHVRAPSMADPVVLYRQGGSLWCRSRGDFEVDGRPGSARAPLAFDSGVRGDGFSFSLEPVV